MKLTTSKSYLVTVGLVLLLPWNQNVIANPVTSEFSEQDTRWSSLSKFRTLDACQKAANKGNVDAALELGYAYEKGAGVPRDFIRSVYWFKQAAQRGNSDGFLNLAFAFAFGKGVNANKSMVFLYSELSMKYGDKFVAKGLNGTTLPEIPYIHILDSRMFAENWRPGLPLPNDNYFPTEPASTVVTPDNNRPPSGNDPAPQIVLEYHVLRNIPVESLGTYSFANDGIKGWDLIAIIQQQPPPMMSGIPSMPVDAIFKRRRNISVPNGFIKWEYKFYSSPTFSTTDSLLGLETGWEIATVFMSKTSIPPVHSTQFVVALKRRLPD